VLIAVERLLIKSRQPASRAEVLVELHRRLRDERAAVPADDERALAAEVKARKLAVSAELSGVASCATCATGKPWPRGHYDGGDCCAGVTADLFDENELAALAHAGTKVRHLTAPREDHVGCAFRGPVGCTLELAHRPARCVHYICDVLRRELYDRGQLDAIEARLRELDGAMKAFRAAHRARTDRDTVAPLLEAIADVTAKSRSARRRTRSARSSPR
jgi:hypothetical protein